MWDPDTRWIGNEAGVAHSPNYLTVDELDFSVMTDNKDTLSHKRFLPAECDCRMRLENWFYSDKDEHTVKSVDELMGLYYYSVGRGANLLINIGPDRNGKLPEKDKNTLLNFSKRIEELKTDFLPCEKVCEPKKVTLSMEQRLVNHVIIQEKITSEEIENFEVKVYPYSYGEPITVYRGTTIGHKAICSFPTIRTTKVEITFDKDKEVCASLKYIPLF
jgi:alpha-L-fucosidase